MKDLIRKLIRKHTTNDPFQIAEEMGIIVFREALGSLNGFYNIAYRQKFIHVNEELPEARARFVCAHELGHAILHSKFGNTQFLHSRTFLNCDRIEAEANRFAVHLLITDDDIQRFQTVERLSRAFGIAESLVRLRCV